MFGLAFLLVSSIIGAGFATGAELLVFFGNAGLAPWVIALMVGGFLFALMAVTVALASRGFNPPKILFVPLYFAFFVVMTAGIAELLGVWGAVLSLGASVLVVIYGFDKLVRFNKYLIGLVLVVILVIAIPNLGVINVGERGISSVAWSALLYAGMNTMLFPIINRAKKKLSGKEILGSCLMACMVLGFFVLVLLSSIDPNSQAQFPVLELSSSWFVMVAIFLCMFSSQFIALFNIDSETKKTQGNVGKLIAVCVVAFIIGSFGFSRVMGFVYPIVGMFMIAFLVCACVWHLIFPRIRRR